MKVYEAMARAFVREGCEALFSLMGDANMSLVSAAASEGMRICHSRNEAGAVAMADGYFRATGKLGLCTVTHGPGLTQTGTSLVAARKGRSAVLIVTGAFASNESHKGQYLDQEAFVRGCGVEYRSVSDRADVAATLADAFATARSGRMPVVIGVPQAMQEGDIDGFDYHPIDTQRPHLPRNDIEALFALLSTAERPVIVAGRGARAAGARDALVELGRRSGALLATTLQAKGWLAGEEWEIGISGGYASLPGRQLLAEADCIIGIGAELGVWTRHGNTDIPPERVGRIDLLPADRFTSKALHVEADAREAAAELNRLFAAKGADRTGYRTPQTAQTLQHAQPVWAAPNDGIDPREAARQISASLPENATITQGVGHYMSFAPMYAALPRHADMCTTSEFGAVGQTLPVAIGRAVGMPDRPHLVIEGDGSLFMNIQELDSVVRNDIRMTLIVWNDAGYGAEVHKLKIKGHETSSAAWRSPDFVMLARAFGGDGALVEDIDGLAPALRQGFAAPGLYLIDLRISPTTISDDYLRKHYGEDGFAGLLGVAT